MLYICPRCSFETEIYQKYFMHTTKKVKCVNVNQVDENLDLFVIGRNPSKKKIKKVGEKCFMCTECQDEFKSAASAYKHYKDSHMCVNKIKKKTENLYVNGGKVKKNYCKKLNETNFTNINQKNYINNNIIIINNNNLNCFGNESFEHIDKLLLLNAIFNYDIDKSMKEKKYTNKDTPHTINVFVKIHLELLKCPKNLNCYIQGYYSNSVTYLNDMYEFENDSTDNAIYARVKTIYDRTMDVYKDIHRNYPCLLLEIYDKYNSLIDFEFSRTDYDKMLNYLTTTLTDLFELYQHSNFKNQNEEKRLSNSFKSHLFDVKNNTKKSFQIIDIHNIHKSINRELKLLNFEWNKEK
jgi:hypothetical protein